MKDRVRLLERRDIDELIILDIAATPNGRGPRFDEVRELCDNLFCPVTIGGGIRSLDDIGKLLRCGADKVSIKTAAQKNPTFIADAARKFGSQAIVVSIDYDGKGEGNCGSASRIGLIDSAKTCFQMGAGELLLNSVERDGMLAGYDLDLIREVSSAVDNPVIACGGCGSYEHMAEAFRAGAHAVAVGAAFQFLEMTPRGAAEYLSKQGFPMRIEPRAA